MVSHQQVLNLLRKEADMSGYGYDMECPHCEGSGLIGGFAGQRSFFQGLDDMKLTVADRKRLKAQAKAQLNAAQGITPKARKVRTAADRIKMAEAIIAAQGGPIGKKKAKAPLYDVNSVQAALTQLGLA